VIIERQLKHLTRLIDDLLDMSRMTQGKFELRKERTSLSDVVQLALAIARPQLEGKQHKLQIELAPKDLCLSADAARLGQALANLLHNASKYSSDGTLIRLTATAEHDQIIVRVIDQGAGIPADMLERVFDLYRQVDRPEDGTHDGLGIGLTLVKRIVELHGGTVEAASAGRGRGSEFTVRLPREIASSGQETAHAAAVPPSSTRRLRILVADDNRDAAHTLAMLLRLEGHEVRAVHDGVEALAAGDDFAPQLVLMDIGMPLLDGYETARQMQERPWGKQAHLVALTGWGQEADRHKAMAAGFRDHLVKPAEPEALKAVMDRIIANCSPGKTNRRCEQHNLHLLTRRPHAARLIGRGVLAPQLAAGAPTAVTAMMTSASLEPLNCSVNSCPAGRSNSTILRGRSQPTCP
jgi:CheY-like chemotaxis protein/two-component sensor histidine kinase